MIYLVLIPLGILIVPWILARYICKTPQTADLPYGPAAGYLAAAAGLWVVSFFLPDLPLTSETTTLSQHTAGGIVAAILFWYFVQVYRWRFAYWWQEIAALYFFVSGLGVLNELFELLTTKTGLIWIDGSDAWWDLLANTCGAFLAFAAVRLWRSAQDGSSVNKG